ncbi:hypothetical protein MUK42_08367 [Musa troglodytarum]|uniref:Uncharacterized protein n=1 Tax=Musa troglodytarum TaxID=320322 RepID=A0A9E7FM79_9LILI|nr:hypothetical protein MUK42_08367 [Musa troglodytarum]
MRYILYVTGTTLATATDIALLLRPCHVLALARANPTKLPISRSAELALPTTSSSSTSSSLSLGSDSGSRIPIALHFASFGRSRRRWLPWVLAPRIDEAFDQKVPLLSHQQAASMVCNAGISNFVSRTKNPEDPTLVEEGQIEDSSCSRIAEPGLWRVGRAGYLERL